MKKIKEDGPAVCTVVVAPGGEGLILGLASASGGCAAAQSSAVNTMPLPIADGLSLNGELDSKHFPS